MLLTLAAFLLPKNLVAVPQFRRTIHDARYVLMEGNSPVSAKMFIKGYWELRKTLTDIWREADPIGTSIWWSEPFNGKPYEILLGRYQNVRGYTPFSNILLGCWLENRLTKQKSPWWKPNGNEFRSVIYYKEKSKSNIIKKKFVKAFEKEKIRNIKDVGEWLQKSYCKPVSRLLLECFESSPKNALDLLQTLELYKCYIECDGGFSTQIRFAQENYDTVYCEFYKWFINLLTQQLSASSDTDIHTVLLSIFYHCDEKMSDFLDTSSLSNASIRSLGGYQIEIGTILKKLKDPNLKKAKLGTAPSATQLLAQLDKAARVYSSMLGECKENAESHQRAWEMIQLNRITY